MEAVNIKHSNTSRVRMCFRMVYMFDYWIVKRRREFARASLLGIFFFFFAVLFITLLFSVLSMTFHFPTLTAGIKKRSRVPGVMITQFIETLPEGKSHPDFTRKPIALTIQEGRTDSRGSP